MKLYVMFSEFTGIGAFFVGGIVLLGWALDISVFKSLLPGFVTMKANTALCFILIGLALWFVQEKRLNKTALVFCRLCCFIAILIPGITIIEYIYGVNPGIDQILFKENTGALFTTNPGRMAVSTAICFIFLALALLLSKLKSRRFYVLAQILASVVSILALFSLIGYLYGVKILYFGVQGFTAMALHTAVVFFMVSMGVFFAYPAKGLANIFTSDNLGSKIARRLTVFAIILPPFFGWLKLWGEKTGFLPPSFGVSFVAIMNILTLVSCIVWLALFLNRADTERKKAEAILLAHEQQLRSSNQQLTEKEQALRIEVKERKKTEEELQKHLQDLEVFYKASIGREERILELKKEIEQLKNK